MGFQNMRDILKRIMVTYVETISIVDSKWAGLVLLDVLGSETMHPIVWLPSLTNHPVVLDPDLNLQKISERNHLQKKKTTPKPTKTTKKPKKIQEKITDI